MVSPIGCLRCSRSDLRWTLAKTARTTSNTIACPTTSHSIVSATSNAVAARKTATSATTTHTSSPSSVPAPGSQASSSGVGWLPSTLSTSTLSGSGAASATTLLSSVAIVIAAQPRRRPAAYRSRTVYFLHQRMARSFSGLTRPLPGACACQPVNMSQVPAFYLQGAKRLSTETDSHEDELPSMTAIVE